VLGFLSPKNDLAFKRIFGTEKNKDILIHFLNDIFARTDNPIETVTFLKSAQEPTIAAQRASIVDILCQDAIGERFIVEMQVVHRAGFIKRAQYYAAKAYIDQREKGTEFRDLKSVTFLAITDFVLFPEKEKYLSHHVTLDSETHEHNLKDFSFCFLELPKFKKTKEQLKTLTEKWAYFFKHAEQTTQAELSCIVGSDTIIQRAYDELARFAWSQEELRNYDSVDMKQGSEEDIRIQAKMDGQKEEKIAVAKNMLVLGFSICNIETITGLSEADINVLRFECMTEEPQI